jgi:CDP-paratose 2-epimerase
MKVAIITGSNGLIGSQSVSFFAQKGYRVVGIDNDMRSYFFGAEASTRENEKSLLSSYGNFVANRIDIRDYEELEKIFVTYSTEIDIIIHTAAQPSHDWASKEPLTDFSINALGTVNLLELTRKHCPKASFIFTSTNKVYGDSPNRIEGLIEKLSRYQTYDSHGNFKGIDETMSIDNSLHSVFGASKVSADIMVQEYGKYFGINTVCFRGGCLTGPQHRGAELHGFLSYLIKCIVNRKPYVIFGYKGKQVRDNIHSWDLVNMFWHYHQSPRPGEVYNAGGGQENSISILEAIDFINDTCKKLDPDWKYWKDFEISETARTGDHICYVTDLTKFKTHYPSWPGITISLNSLIEEMIKTQIHKNGKTERSL